MVKLTAPILSMGASGSIGKTITTASWRGVKYGRQYVVPANPDTVAQQSVRSVFAMMREQYKRMSAAQRAPWNAFAQGRKFLGVNALIGENIRVLNGEVDMGNYIASPGAKGGIGASNITPATGVAAASIDVAFVDPALPTGWSITNHYAIAFLDQDPTADFVGPFTEGASAAASPTIALTGLTPSTNYWAGGFIEYLKPNGETAYSPSLGAVVASNA